jgi:hypothetical protein
MHPNAVPDLAAQLRGMHSGHLVDRWRALQQTVLDTQASGGAPHASPLMRMRHETAIAAYNTFVLALIHVTSEA